MSDGTAITRAFTVTADGENRLGPFTVPTSDAPYAFELDVDASVLRIDLVDTTGGNTGIVDLLFFGRPLG